MRLVYGSPLPPGVESSTRGELRIRVEKLLIKDGLVHTNIASTLSAAGPRPYTIPVDECAVSALFWGEQQSSSHCIPATPAKPRGAVSLVYPIKTPEQQFSHYLTHMSHSTQKGVELAVFVPTSYSGRHKPVSVGKATVVLDSLKPSTPISGWFAVMSREVRSMDTIKKRDHGESHNNNNNNKEERKERIEEQGEELIEVGKLKLTFTMTFFTRALQSPTRPSVRSTSVNSYEKHQALEEKKRERSQSRENGTVKESHYTGRPSTLVNPDITVIMDTTQTQIGEQEEKLQSQQKEFVDNVAINNSIAAVPVTGMKESKNYSSIQQNSGRTKLTQDLKGSTLPYTSVTPTVEINQQNAIGQLIQKGLSLREKMSKALLPYTASENLSISTKQPLTLSSPTTLRTVPNYIPTTLPNEHIMDNIPILSDSLESSVSSANDESIDSKTDDDMNIKETTTFSKDQEEGYSKNQTERYSLKTPYQPSGLNINENVYVEVDISKIAFSSGRATLGMEEMRVGIRLSKDVKTDEPVESYSSYVHRVPLTRGANHHIVIGFPIRSFSKDKSRMVISFYRVRSAPVANPPGELLLPPPASAQRVLVEETLLGMCIVGLHDQSRDVVLHDPISGEDPTQAYIQVSLRNSAKPFPQGERVNDNLVEKKIQQQQQQQQLEEERNVEGRGRGRREHKAIKEQHYRNNLGNQTRKRQKHHQHSSHNSSSSSSSYISTPASSTCSSVDSTPLLVPSGDGTHEGKNKRISGIVPNSNNNSIPPHPHHPISSSDVVKRESFSRDGVKIAAADIDNDNNSYPVMPAAAAAAADDDNDNDHSHNHNGNDNRQDEKHSIKCNPSTVTSGMNAEKHARLVDAYTTMLPTMHKVGDGNLPDRFRMHVSIRAGKELPLVTVNHNGPPSLSTVAAIDQLDNGVRSAVTSDGRLVLVDSKHRVFQPPSTFFVVEDIYSGADARAASKGIVPDWFVEAAVHGEYDRTFIVPQSQSPQFDYECILSLPWESVFLRQAPKKFNKSVSGKTMQLVPEGSSSPLTSATIATSTCMTNTTSTTSVTNNNTNNTNNNANTTSTLCLQEMRLTLWHAVLDGHKNTSSDLNKNEEEKFWESTAILGECRVDLRSLRFLKVLDGWYRINAIDRVDEVVGYVRVSVRLL